MAERPKTRDDMVRELAERTHVPGETLERFETDRLRDLFDRTADPVRAHTKIRVGAPLLVIGAALTALSVWGPGSLEVAFSGVMLGFGGLTVSAAGIKDLALNEDVGREVKESLKPGL